MTFKQACEIAGKEKKIVLADVKRPGTPDAAKVKSENDVLMLPGIKDLLDKNVIAVRVDMSTPEGKEFAPLLQMNMYPTYAFLMPDGDLLGVINPFLVQKDASRFTDAFKNALQMARDKWSNTRSIKFEDVTLEDILKKAKQENKLVFIDAVTENCQPCLKMLKNVFTLDSVADFYNKNFLNVRIDFSKNYKELLEKYEIGGFPTYLFLDGNGSLVYKNSGFTPAGEFIGFGKTALDKFSSEQGIDFKHLSWNEVLGMAQKENKPIFVDCYTVWCGPCKMMANGVFKEKEVGDYFNAKFVNTKVDMEKGEGIDIKKKYQISAYPTFLYLDKNGNEIFRLVGSMPTAEFMKKSEDGMRGGGIGLLRDKYKAGDRSEKFISEYMNALEESYFMKEASVVASDFLNTPSINILDNPTYWQWFVKFVNDIDSPAFGKIVKEGDKYAAKYGKSIYDKKMFLAWSECSRKFIIKGEDNSVKFDKVGFEKFVKRVKSADVKDSDLIIINAKMYNAESLGEWKEYVTLANARIEKDGIENIPVIEIYNWCIKIDQQCTDKVQREVAARWVNKIIPIVDEQEAKRMEMAKKGGMMPAMSMINFKQAFAKLSESLTK
jgi:thiol-disulfide isomerase/thioredoxin